MPVKGVNSPEYRALQSHYSALVNILDHSVKKHDVSMNLKLTEMPWKMLTSGRRIIQCVLHSIECDAIKFYNFLAVLQGLSNCEDIMEEIHGEFLCKNILCIQFSLWYTLCT